MRQHRRCFRSARTISSATGLCLILAAPSAAQATGAASDPHRHAIVMAADAGSLPTVFQDPGCGDVTGGQDPELGLAVSLIDRLTSIFFIAADMRASAGLVVVGCDEIIPSPVEVAPGLWETRFGFRAKPGTPHIPLVRNVLRAGFETPAKYPAIVRAALGGGFIWSTWPAPMATASIALSSSGKGRRIYVELERDISWASVSENRSQFRQDSVGARTPLADFVVTRKLRPTWTTARVGFEWPLL